MNTASNKKGFAAHWDWLAAGLGFAALAVAIVLFLGGESENAENAALALKSPARAKTGVVAISPRGK